MVQIEIFARTEVGCLRSRNEDRFLVVNLGTGDRSLQPRSRIHRLGAAGTLLAVCDGMGGAAGGDIAAALAADTLAEALGPRSPFSAAAIEGVQGDLLAAVDRANQRVLGAARRDPTLRGMGTTVTAALLFGPELAIVHVGDSRAYLLRCGRLQALTTDHSVVGQMVAAGKMTAEEARTTENRNVLLQALGVMPKIGPELVTAPLCADDLLLLCSDGLTTPLSEEAVLEILLREDDPMRCCRALTEAACVAGGPDNVTVVLARLRGHGLPSPEGREIVHLQRRQVTVG